MPRIKLNFITGNAHKLAEVQAILDSTIEVNGQTVDVPEIQGPIEEIAKEKARRASAAINGPALTEDTALEFHALNGLPGPYIKEFFNALGNEGLNRMLDGFNDRTAESVCTLAFCSEPGAEPIIFQGRTKGVIVRPRGPANFAYDPIFEVGAKTYAEMERKEKNQISDRYKALAKFQQWLIQNHQQKGETSGEADQYVQPSLT